MSITFHVCVHSFILRQNYRQKLSTILLHFFFNIHFPKIRYNKCIHFFLVTQMVFPCMFDDIPALRDLKEAACLLAEKEDWPPLYDVSVLNNNKVRCS